MNHIVRLLFRYPGIGSVAFLMFAAVGAYVSYRGWHDARMAPDDPVLMTWQEAVERSRDDKLYVELQNGGDLRWDCRSAYDVEIEGVR